MKKLTAILLITIYSLSSFGISLKHFYCCGKLKSVTISLSHGGNAKCNKGNSESGCCKTKYQFFKVKDNHFATAQCTAPLKYQVDLITFYSYSQTTSFLPNEDAIINSNHAPPLISGVPLYISNCIFTV